MEALLTGNWMLNGTVYYVVLRHGGGELIVYHRILLYCSYHVSVFTVVISKQDQVILFAVVMR